MHETWGQEPGDIGVEGLEGEHSLRPRESSMWGQTVHGGRFKVTHAPALQPLSVSNPNVLIGSPG